MAVQSLMVGFIVFACSTYAIWTLMPVTARRALALWMLKLAPPAALARVLHKAARPAGACGGCDSCGDATTAPKQAQTITFHRRPGR